LLIVFPTMSHGTPNPGVEKKTNGKLSVRKLEPKVKFAPSPLSSHEDRPKPKIACVTPTLQVEQGFLSPNPSQGTVDHHGPSTPRMPLTELDSSQLSQRLFHNSPNLSSQNLSQISPASSFCQHPSPSQLLNTQEPNSAHAHGAHGARTAVRDRRHQLNTERQLVELRQQVEQLGNMMATRQHDQSSSSLITYQIRVEQLEQEREELELMVEEKELQLEEMTNSMSNQNAEIMKDMASLRVECQELGEEAVQKERAFSLLQVEYQKTLKTIQGLNSYISTLPAVEEVRELRAKLEARTSEQAEKDVRTLELERSVKSLNLELQNLKKEYLKLNIANKEAIERNKELSAKVADVEKVRMEARNLDDDQVELVLHDKQQLQLELEKLKRLQAWKTEKFETENSKLEEQVRKLGQLVESSNMQIRTNSTQLREANAIKCQLESELKEKQEMITSFSKKLEKYKTEISHLKCNNESSSQLDKYYTRLSRCMGKCVTELNSLTDLCGQIMGGDNPNMSLLLGTKSDFLSPVLSLDRDLVSLGQEEKLEVVRQQLDEVTKVQGEIKDLRSKISDKYTDILADNMSCLLQ